MMEEKSCDPVSVTSGDGTEKVDSGLLGLGITLFC